MLVSNQETEAPTAKERVLDTAERLFARKGFASTTLRDIATELKVTHASLYYHFPGGKEDLFASVTERTILRHGQGLAEAMGNGTSSIREKLQGAARWLLMHDPMDLMRMATVDMPALSEAVARRLMNLVYENTILRIQQVFAAAITKGELTEECNPGLIAGAFFGLVENLFTVPEFAVQVSRESMAYELIEVLLRGLGYVEGGKP